ncbi:hypothetical protein [Mucilaginibacter sp. FT3.2]|uniref:hypothetical protein n=1 Tax=Mucilaginibacter sp. FT3.2 TaxID=2723090 RepID=UPI0016208328|nr:hypothetical protein [Mucilaginibacter sp. FT3.2]MBB6233214.1 hypothetical protein [Mucilaginibacter sp. FT3.2]
MKTIKVLLIALVALFTFEGAKAQVVVKARVGAPVHRHYHHRPVRRTVVVRHRVRRPYHHRPVVVHRRVVRHY